MADELDNEGYNFISQQQVTLPSQQNTFKNIHFGGKARRTKIPKRAVMARGKTYISDEPERFIQYIEKYNLKNQLSTEADAINLIADRWHDKDKSLAHLIDGLRKEGVLQRELGALVNTRQVQGWFKYRIIARRIGMKTKVLKKYEKATNPSVLDDLLKRFTEGKKAPVDREALFYKTKQGTIKGKQIIGELVFVKINNRTIPRYRDPVTKQFIKI
jgi:hypothetical protein